MLAVQVFIILKFIEVFGAIAEDGDLSLGHYFSFMFIYLICFIIPVNRLV